MENKYSQYTSQGASLKQAQTAHATWAANNNDVTDVANHSLDCQVGSCQPGDAYEFYVISKSNYISQWAAALPSTENYKFLPYSSSDMTAYINILRDIFKNACL